MANHNYPDACRFKMKFKEMPNMDLPLALLATLGGANKNTARVWANHGKIKIYKSDRISMISVAEMKRLQKEGVIVIG